MFNDIPILCVDNDLDSLEMTLLWLKMNGCKATAVTSCEEAMQLIEVHKFDLCIIEYRLAGHSGVELCHAIRMRCPATSFILSSCDTRPKIQREAALAGMYFLAKPIDIELLHQIVSSIVHCDAEKVA